MADTQHGDHQAVPHWGYSGHIAPEHWGELAPDYALCALGRAQSPIDLAEAQRGALAPVVYRYGQVALHIRNNGHSIQVEGDGAGGIELEGRPYSLLQFHFHAPSEHTVAGRYYDMEAHLVHKSAEGVLAVVGVFLTSGHHHANIAPFWEHMPSYEGESYADEEIIVRPEVLLPASRQAYRYEGSLTTPPCSEGVQWIVLADPVEVSPEQLAAFRALYTGNNRPPQPRHGRMLWIVE